MRKLRPTGRGRTGWSRRAGQQQAGRKLVWEADPALPPSGLSCRLGRGVAQREWPEGQTQQSPRLQERPSASKEQEPEAQGVSRLFPMVTLSGETPRPLELNQQGGVRCRAWISQLHLQSISLETLSGLCVHPWALYPGQIRFSSPSKCAHE